MWSNAATRAAPRPIRWPRPDATAVWSCAESWRLLRLCLRQFGSRNSAAMSVACAKRRLLQGGTLVSRAIKGTAAMLETDKVFAGSIPENYDRYMVPLIFEAFAADLAQRAASLSPSAVLEIAAGTGVVTRALAPKLSPGASYIVTDLNQPMLDYAASRQAPDSRIKWRQADALTLPFENAAFDLVC